MGENLGIYDEVVPVLCQYLENECKVLERGDCARARDSTASIGSALRFTFSCELYM